MVPNTSAETILISETRLLAQLPQFGPPSATAAVWLAIVLVPVSALFSALCLALAAFARSTKEGQYYLMPLLLVVPAGIGLAYQISGEIKKKKKKAMAGGG